MKTKLIAAAVIALAAISGASAFAKDSGNDGTYLPMAIASTSTVTRAQVQEDLVQARKEGTFDLDSDSASIRSTDSVALAKPAAVSTVSRSDVRAETSQWAKANHASNDADRKLNSQ
jgi:Domain of unknown function (DUF4148)